MALRLMPSRTLMERRDRAMFALAYIGAMRESALISLRLRHVDIQERRIEHNGRELRAKNGKTFEICWFKGTEGFQPVFVAWVEELVRLGAGRDDALFPDVWVLASLDGVRLGIEGSRPVWQSMKTAQAVDAVFARVSKLIGLKVKPHSVRDTISQLGLRVCNTPEQHKAWSLNFGHEKVATTYENYGKMSALRKRQVMAEINVTDKVKAAQAVRLKVAKAGKALLEAMAALAALGGDCDQTDELLE